MRNALTLTIFLLLACGEPAKSQVIPASDAAAGDTTPSDAVDAASGPTSTGATLVGGETGEPCDPKTQSLGCTLKGAPSHCQSASKTWQAAQPCGTHAEDCKSGTCGSVPFALCVGAGKKVTCPSGLAGGRTGEPCDPAIHTLGCTVDGAPTQCDANKKTWQAKAACTVPGETCQSGTCGGVAFAQCGAKAVGCP